MSLAKQRVLCVDDDVDTLLMLAQLLLREGFAVSTAETVEDALKLSQEDSFDLYILDTWLLRESGINLCLKIRGFDSISPIVIYSGAATLNDRVQAIGAGATEFVPEPYIEELLEIVRKLPNTFEA